MIECVNVTKLANLYNDAPTDSDQHEVFQKNNSDLSKPLNDIMGVLKNKLPKDPSVKHLHSIVPDNFDHASFLSAEFFASIFNYVKYCVIAYLRELNLSGPASVAIDNKIEQALDLVKSHLMFAVREEVEVLKEQIKELIEKNSLLEAENKFLRNEAAPETLAKLLQQQPVVPQPSTILPPSQPQQLLQQKLILQQKLQGNNKQFVKQQQPQKQLD